MTSSFEQLTLKIALPDHCRLNNFMFFGQNQKAFKFCLLVYFHNLLEFRLLIVF